MKTTPLLISVALSLAATASHAAVISQTFGLSSSAVIPDGDLNGVVQTISPTTTIGLIDSITVNLNTSGGWNGDLYAYIWHDGEIAVLLNRMGRTSVIDDGSATGGITVVFDDLASTDIHSASGGFGTSVSGTYQPDGRNIHPYSALDSSTRGSMLSVFTGDAAAGEWRLFIADVAAGESSTLVSWSITLTGEAIPEPSATLLSSLAGLALLLRRKR